MKKLLTLAIVLLAVAAQAQIKVHDNGHISIGSLTQAFGIQVQPSGYTYFRTQSSEEWSWATLSYANHMKQKHWIVENPSLTNNRHVFFVTGDGYVYKKGSYRAVVGRPSARIEDAGAVLDQITGQWYIPEEEGSKGLAGFEEGRRPAVSAEEVKAVLPEAVTTDDKEQLYVDYEALTVFLIEALKEQRQETELLRKALEEHGLIEPRKR